MPDISSRRDWLAACSTALASCIGGCTSRFGSEFPQLQLEEASISSGEGVYSAELVRQFSKSHPAKVEIAFENTTDEQRTYSFSACPPFSGLYGSPSSDSTYGLVLVPERAGEYVTFYRPRDGDSGIEPFERPSEAVPDSPTDGSWQSEGKIDHHPISLSRTISPGDSLTNTYHVLHAFQKRGCELAESNRFESNSHFDSKKRWWFELRRQ